MFLQKKGCKQISWTGKLVFPEQGLEYFADTKCYLYNKKKQLEPVKRKENVEFISTKTNIRKCYKLYNTNYKSKKRKSRKKGNARRLHIYLKYSNEYELNINKS